MHTNTAPTQQSREVRLTPLFAYAIPIYLASLIITGYRIYFHNQALQIPLIYLINDPTLYPNDPFAQTLPYYASLLWWPIAWIARLIPIETLFPVIFLLERALILSAAAYLALTFAPGSRLAAVSAMAWFALGPLPILGGGTLITSYPEQTGLAIPFILFAIAFFYKTRPYAWAIAMAISFDLNSMYATYALVYFGAALISQSEYRRTWKQWVPALALFLILASPGIHLTLAAISKPAGNKELWMAASLFRLPHHLYPSTWPTSRFIHFGILLAATVTILARNRNSATKLYRIGMAWAITSVVWLIMSDAVVLLRSPSMIVLQSARATDFWYAFSAIALTSTCAMRAPQPRYHSVATATLFATLLICTPYNTPTHYTVLALAILAYYLYDKTRQPANPHHLTTLVTALVVFSALPTLISGQYLSTPDRYTMQMADWARTNTPRNAVFLVNPNMGAFRALTQRSAFVTWKDGSAILWDRSYTAEWVTRMNALGCDILHHAPKSTNVTHDLNTLYNTLTDQSVQSLSTRYKIAYWIVPPTKHSNYPTIYQNPKLKVLAITPNG